MSAEGKEDTCFESLFTLDAFGSRDRRGSSETAMGAFTCVGNEVSSSLEAEWGFGSWVLMDNDERQLGDSLFKGENTLVEETYPGLQFELVPQSEYITQPKQEQTQLFHRYDHPQGIAGIKENCFDENKWWFDPTISFTPKTTGGLTTVPDSTPTTPVNMMNPVQTPVMNTSPPLSSRNNVYISDLPSHWNTEKLRGVCLNFGIVISAKVVYDATTNRSRGYGFVMFQTEENAALCVNSLNNHCVDGRPLICRLAHERAMPSFAHMGRTVWGPSSNEAATTATPQFTTVPEEQLARHRTWLEGISRFDKPSNDDLKQGFGPMGYNSDQRCFPPVQKTRNVFIQGLQLHWNTDKLRSLCGTYGKVQSAKVVRDAMTSQSCGHGFVLFETEEEASLCIAGLNGFTTEGKTLACRSARDKVASSGQSNLTSESTPVIPPLSTMGGTFTPTSATPTNTATQCGNDFTFGITTDCATSAICQQHQQGMMFAADFPLFTNTVSVGNPLPGGAGPPRMPPSPPPAVGTVVTPTSAADRVPPAGISYHPNYGGL